MTSARETTMNQLSGAEAVVRMLRLHGVEHVFGLCGDTSLPFYDALYRTGSDIRHVLARDERSAAYMADGYARVTGKVGVCEGPSGGGATYILPGVVEANESSIPLLALTTDIAVGSRGKFTLTELDQEALFRPLCKWTRVADTARSLPGLFRTAFREMTTGKPGAAHIGLPFDVQNDPVDEGEIWADPAFGRYPALPVAGDPDAVAAAADLLLAARRPIFVCGGGIVISGAEEALRRVAEAAGAMVATTISGQGSISDEHPLAVGVVGSNGGVIQTRELVDAADLVVFVGCRAGSVTTERWRHPVPGKTKVIHIDVDPGVLGVSYKTELSIAGDARLTLEALERAIGQRGGAGGDVQALVAEARRSKRDAFGLLAGSEDRPIRPERVVADLQAVLDPDATVVCDPGTPCPYFSAYYDQRATGRHFISNRAHGALGYALSASLGAHIGRPGVKTVAVMGDGSFGFTVGELETVVRLGTPITFVVISNAAFGWIKAGQRHGYESRFYSVDFSRTNHAAVAEAFGVRSWRVEDPARLRAVLAEAVEADEPTLVDVICQPLDEARAPVSEWVA